MPMNEASITEYISDTFQVVQTVTADGSTFFYYDLDNGVPINKRFAFATIVTNDDPYDQFSNLNRESVFRLNIGVSKQTFRSMFGSQTPQADADAEASGASGYDFTALGQVMPHPVYAQMNFVCVLNPSDETFRTKVTPLLAEAYKMDVKRNANWKARAKA